MANFVKIGTVDDVAPGRPLIYDFDYETVAVFQVGDDEYLCIEDLCTHEEYPLSEGKQEDCRVECPLHGSWFDLRTGEALNMPAVKAVRTFEVKIEGNELYVAEPEDSW